MTGNLPVATVTDDALQAAIAAAAARCLRTPLGTIGPDVPLSVLGLDSLAAIELTAELEDTTGWKLPADLLAECPDLRSLTARLQHIGLNNGIATPEDPFDRMLADAVLPEDVRPVRGVAVSASLENARAILLTGATGFLGGALAKEILQRSSARLVCLVRPNSAGSTDDRLRRHLAAHGVDALAFDSRVRTIDGDLAQPRLGLSESRFDALARNVDAICHAGAAVNWVHSYGGLRAANVTATLELLRLACRGAIPFHFVSSLSVCYSTSAPPQVDEEFDALPHLRGLHLGYAQTKAVAESLVRQAGDRGLPIRIYRPALISGDSATGAFNRDDVIATLIRGCVQMGAAPDLDWKLDSLPVDVVARSIVSLSGHPGPVFHLAHERPRHWRECVLWMRTYGYPIRLVSYHQWLHQLDRETQPDLAAGDAHPLRALRTFFLDRPAEARGLTRPEIYEESRRSHASDEHTRRADPALVTGCPALDAALLTTYFNAFIRDGHLPPPSPTVPPTTGARRQAGDLRFDAAFFAKALPDLRVVGAEEIGGGSDTSIISELTAWRSHRKTGVFRVRLTQDADGRRVTRDVIVKAKPRDVDIVAVGDALANLCDPAIGRAYARWSQCLGAVGSHTRELAVCAQTDRRFARHTPAVLGAIADADTGTWLMILEHINDACVIDSAGRRAAWTRDRLDLAVSGMASLQAIWYGRERELRALPWIGYVASADSTAEASELWTALAVHASPAFSAWANPAIVSIQRRLIAGIAQWWPALERLPRTLIHHDFNPRNICIRGCGGDMRLSAYDWELATIGAPQRDLAELLCFALPPSAASEEIEWWIERHRAALAGETATPIDPAAWREGFRAALYDVMINRLGMYALVHRIRRQAFLPAVVQTWCRLYQQFPLEHDQ